MTATASKKDSGIWINGDFVSETPAELQREPKFKLDDLKKAGVRSKSRIEITVFEGAHYYNGDTPAPTVNPEGYDPSNEMTDKPGARFLGYVNEMQRGQVTLAFEIPTRFKNPRGCMEAHIGTLYFNERVIHSFELLDKK